MMTEPAEHAKRSKLNMVIRLLACQCSLWRLKQAELKYQTRGEIACNSCNGRMSLEHIQVLSFWGFFLFFTTIQRVYHCQCFGTCWLCEVWCLLEWHTHEQVPMLGTAMWKCHSVTGVVLVARAKSSLHTSKQEHCVSLPQGILLTFVFHWNNSRGMVREVAPSLSVMFPV